MKTIYEEIATVLGEEKAQEILGTAIKKHAIAQGAAYAEAAREYFAVPMDKPLYSRIDSKFMKAFGGMPVIEQPEYSLNKQPPLSLKNSNTKYIKELYRTGSRSLMESTRLPRI